MISNNCKQLIVNSIQRKYYKSVLSFNTINDNTKQQFFIKEKDNQILEDKEVEDKNKNIDINMS